VYQDGRGSEPMIDVGSAFPADALNIFTGPFRLVRRAQKKRQPLQPPPPPLCRRRSTGKSSQ
jgi:hypothetical protein